MNPTPSRRDFLRTTCCSAALAALGLTLTSCDSSAMEGDPGPDLGNGGSSGETGIVVSGNTITLDLTGSQASAVAAAGGFLFIQSAQALVVNLDGQTIRAFTSVCTHQQCDINRFQSDEFVCPCHGSRFDTRGQVVQGPANAPLRQFSVTRNGDTVTIVMS